MIPVLYNNFSQGLIFVCGSVTQLMAEPSPEDEHVTPTEDPTAPSDLPHRVPTDCLSCTPWEPACQTQRVYTCRTRPTRTDRTHLAGRDVGHASGGVGYPSSGKLCTRMFPFPCRPCPFFLLFLVQF